MTQGTIYAYDPEDQTGYVQPDGTDDEIPFDIESMEDVESQGEPRTGQTISFKVQGGMTGDYAVEIRRIG